MTEWSPELQKLRRRALNPQKLEAARMAAGFTRVAEVCRLIGMSRWAYNRWEGRTPRSHSARLKHPDAEIDPERSGRRPRRQDPITHVDYVLMVNLLRLYRVAYEDITDAIPDEAPQA